MAHNANTNKTTYLMFVEICNKFINKPAVTYVTAAVMINILKKVIIK